VTLAQAGRACHSQAARLILGLPKIAGRLFFGRIARFCRHVRVRRSDRLFTWMTFI
jgi:hypothetical protein